jgi:hypothetical protein
MTIEVRNFNENEVKQELIEFIKNKTLIPIIGAGFSKGCEARSGKVPDGNELKRLMIDKILKQDKNIKEEDLIKKKFSDIAHYYKLIVNEETYRRMLKDRFLNVELSDEKKSFLKIDWPYIYTLNVDDAIEKVGYSKVLPYKRLSDDLKKTFKCVFKLHGDVEHELKYPEEVNIIFDHEKYIESLHKNELLLTYFKSDYKGKNILYLGCSLSEDEIDIKYIVSTVKNDFNYSNSKRFLITSKEPDYLTKIDLETNYGINSVIIVDNYDNFYEELYQLTLHNSINLLESTLDAYKNPEVISLKEKDINENLSFLLGKKNVYKDNNFVEPFFSIDRKIISNILGSLKSNGLIVLYGSRVSGKTYLLMKLIKRIQDKQVLFFPSYTRISNDGFFEEISKLENHVIIFDSNSLTSDDINKVSEIKDIVRENNTNIIITINSSDRLLIPLLSIKDDDYLINKKLNADEIKDFNNLVSQIGIAKMDRNNGNFLENIYFYAETYKDTINFSPLQYKGLVDKEEVSIFILLASEDKVYYSQFDALGISYKKVEEVIKKYEPIIQEDYADFLEIEMHSSKKVIVNSKSYLLKILQDYLETNRNIVPSVICNIVKKMRLFKGLNVAKNLILFDTLNDIFRKKEGGASGLIFQIYNELSSILYEDPNYWIQRAKSILYLKREDEKMLLDAISYAKTAYNNSKNDRNFKVLDNATLTLAMLYGRIINSKKFKDNNYLNETINYYYQAFNSRTNVKYIDRIIIKANKNNKNDLKNLCYYLLNKKPPLSNEIKRKAEFIINKVMSFSEYK